MPSAPLHRIYKACSQTHSLEDIRQTLEQDPESIKQTSFFGRTPLHAHCYQSKLSLEIVQCLVQAWPEAVRSRDSAGSHPLHYALRLSNKTDESVILAVVKYFVEAWPESVHASDNSGMLPLHHACATSPPSLEVIQYLVASWPASVQVRMRSFSGKLPLHMACEYAPSLQVVQCLVEEWPESIYLGGDYDMTPLHCILSRHSKQSTTSVLDIVQYIVQRCPEAVKATMPNGRLPLHCACNKKASLEVIQFLVETWPDSLRVAEQDTGNLPIHASIQANSCPEVIKYMAQSWPGSVKVQTNISGRWGDVKGGGLPIHLACKSSSPSLEIIEYLVRLWPGSLQVPSTHTTLKYVAREQGEHYDKEIPNCLPLQIACGHSASLAILRYLVEAFPDSVKATTRFGNPLDWAYQNSSKKYSTYSLFRWQIKNKLLPKVAQCLLGNVEQSADHMLHIALQNNVQKVATIEYLLQNWPTSARAIDHLGRTPLHVACQKLLSRNVIEAVATYPDTLTAIDCDGRLPLHAKCEKGSGFGVIRLLVERAPALLKTRDNHLRLPLHCACDSAASPETLKYLVQAYPAAAMAADSEGRLPLHAKCANVTSVKDVEALIQASPASVEARDNYGRIPLLCCHCEVLLDVIYMQIRLAPNLLKIMSGFLHQTARNKETNNTSTSQLNIGKLMLGSE